MSSKSCIDLISDWTRYDLTPDTVLVVGETPRHHLGDGLTIGRAVGGHQLTPRYITSNTLQSTSTLTSPDPFQLPSNTPELFSLRPRSCRNWYLLSLIRSEEEEEEDALVHASLLWSNLETSGLDRAICLSALQSASGTNDVNRRYLAGRHEWRQQTGESQRASKEHWLHNTLSGKKANSGQALGYIFKKETEMRLGMESQETDVWTRLYPGGITWSPSPAYTVVSTNQYLYILNLIFISWLNYVHIIWKSNLDNLGDHLYVLVVGGCVFLVIH